MRVDARLDESGVPHVLDVNPNPALGRSGGIRDAALAAGWTWERFVRAQLDWAC
jgi:D-alanine-D-alanine ligase-like ATP-grasp enzyme